MQVTELLEPNRISCDHQAASKKRVLEQLSHLIADDQAELSQTQVFDSLISRERLGSTGLGRGVAIPHGRIKDSDQTLAAVLKLQDGVDYDAVDNQPVDLFFALLVPEHSTDEHLQLLSQLAQMLSDSDFVQQLRDTDSAEGLLKTLKSWHSEP
ncbi:MAG: PTS IIA-like nitrogen regulatory protein PtsN [Pseudomonadota bacterium]